MPSRPDRKSKQFEGAMQVKVDFKLVITWVSNTPALTRGPGWRSFKKVSKCCTTHTTSQPSF